MADIRNYWNKRYESGAAASGNFIHSEEANRWFYHAKFRRVRDVLKASRIKVAGMSVLDAACGSGAFVPFWLELGAKEVVGTDISDAAVEMCGKAYSNEKSCRFERVGLASESSPIEKESFDLVSIFEAICLITEEKDFVTALKNLCSWVKPGGYLLISDQLPEVTVPRHERLKYHSRSIYENVFRDHGIEIIGLYQQSRVFTRRIFPPPLQFWVERIFPWVLYVIDRMLLSVPVQSAPFVDEVYYYLPRKRPQA